MARGNNRIVSGFVGMNSGKIEDCYTNMSIKAKTGQSGFCGMNSGEIKTSYSECSYSGKKDIVGFCKNTKGVSDCFFIKSEKMNAESIFDKSYAVTKEEVIEKIAKKENWKDKESWKFEPDGLKQMKRTFDEICAEAEGTIEIHSPEELYDVANKVNEGLDEYVYAKIELTDDLDLKGKKWIPIGKGEMAPFRGVFNGNGHAIRNFIIRQSKEETSGFFGYLKDAIVENLKIDCILHGGKYAGAMAGVNDGGKILGCQAAVAGDAGYCLGGFVGKNSGVIEDSECIGKVKNPFNKKIAGISSAATAVAIVAVVLVVLNHRGNGRTRYPAIPISEDAVPIAGDKDKPATGGNSVSFEVNTDLVCKKGKDEVNINFKNPGKSNHDIVVSLQITDEELLNTIGTTGRSKEEQKELEKDKSYDPKTSRIVLSESGSVPPGYELDTLELSALEDGTKLPKGTYQAIVYLTLYDINTNQKAMINSQTPVTLVVKG